jgi:protein-tyrosine phosphatase
MMDCFPSSLEGAPNFRDLGGYRAADGRRVRHAQLFRSEALASLTDADLTQVAALEIGLVYDLRGAEERARASNRWPLGRVVETLSGLESVELDAVAFFGWRERIGDPSFDADAAREWMRTAYAAMPRLFAGVLVSLFDRLNTAAPPVTLIHCTAGKDRTGYVSAMLLLALGVSRDDVLQDYLLTRLRRPPMQLLEALLGHGRLRAYSPPAQAALACMADVREDYLATAFGATERDFGSVEEYFSQACGFGRAQREQLRARLLA